jgi:hydroxymethylglutaryl-CoA reductase
MTMENTFKGFSKLEIGQRWNRLVEEGLITLQDVEFFRKGGIRDTSLGEKFIENVVGYFQIPLGVATNFRVDGKDYVIPMAVEETSIIAAASKTARWIRENGSITTEILGRDIIGQIQIAKVKNFARFEKLLKDNQGLLVDSANKDVAAGLVRRGGGVKSLTVRRLNRPDGEIMAVVHVAMDPVDSMGANIINQVCEYLKTPIESLTDEVVTMCILSNLVDTRLTKAVVKLGNIESSLGEKIEEASIFAETDPYRAATNNKGVLNGMDPILIATGNDWRAVEAGVHAYATQDGKYGSITKWRFKNGQLKGELIAPIVVATVGGVTNLHPTAAVCLRMLRLTGSQELSRLVAAVGLVQNLGALKALTTVGIIEGHMKLHIKNLTLGAGASEPEIPLVVKKLEEILALKKRISLSNAIEVLSELRRSKSAENTHGATLL